MLARISGIFKKEEEKPKPDLNDIIQAIKSLSVEEKQLVKNALDEPQMVSVTLTEQSAANIATTEESTVATTEQPTTNYEYKTNSYKRRKD